MKSMCYFSHGLLQGGVHQYTGWSAYRAVDLSRPQSAALVVVVVQQSLEVRWLQQSLLTRAM